MSTDDIYTGSPYLMQQPRPLWRACQDRHGWRRLEDAPCAACAVATACERQRAAAPIMDDA